MNRQDAINAQSQAELQALIDEINDGAANFDNLKDLRKNINERLRKIDPESAPGGKRAAKTIKAMEALKEIKKVGKDLKQVQWGNSKESAEHVFEKNRKLQKRKTKI